MELNWTKAESRLSPVDLDKVSSPHGVYMRKNIEAVSVEDPMTKETYTKYVYDEVFLTHSEYDRYILIQDINLKHDDDVVDDYTLKLIEEGIL